MNDSLIEKAAQIMQDEGMLTIRVHSQNGYWILKVNGEVVAVRDSRNDALKLISAAALKASSENGVNK